MKRHKLRFLIPFIPVLGIFIVLFSDTQSWFNRDADGNFDSVISPKNHVLVFLGSVLTQQIVLTLICLTLFGK